MLAGAPTTPPLEAAKAQEFDRAEPSAFNPYPITAVTPLMMPWSDAARKGEGVMEGRRTSVPRRPPKHRCRRNTHRSLACTDRPVGATLRRHFLGGLACVALGSASSESCARGTSVGHPSSSRLQWDSGGRTDRASAGCGVRSDFDDRVAAVASHSQVVAHPSCGARVHLPLPAGTKEGWTRVSDRSPAPSTVASPTSRPGRSAAIDRAMLSAIVEAGAGRRPLGAGRRIPARAGFCRSRPGVVTGI
jgi:hypothetical protein